MKRIITTCALAFISAYGHAQMKDITVTLQPTVSYNWFDKNTAIDDGVMYGGRVGFGFGETIELRGVYEKSADLKNTVSGLDLFDDDFVNNFNARSVEIERIGGEFKVNIPTRSTFVPYLTLGAGVQNLKVDVAATDAAQKNELKSEQIYLNLGLGTQIRLGERLFLNLEAKNTVFNMDPASVLFQDGQDQSAIEGYLDDNNNSRMYNWSVLAGLQLYLGGRSPENMSALDRAYRNEFSGGMGNFKLIFEPAGAFINFDNDSNLADTYLLGGKIGFDLNQYVGIRGYYYQATKNEQVSFDFDDIAMYGGDFVAKLNVSRGLVPYLTVGGGYLNVNSNKYIGKDGLTGASSGYFAKGGLGLNVPLGTNLEVFGDASMMFTSERNDDDLQNIISPDELRSHTMYSVGLRLQLGKKSNPDEIVQREIDSRVDDRTKIYQKRIDELESELSDAYKNNDTNKAVRIIEEKKELEQQMDNDRKMTRDQQSKSSDKVKDSDSEKESRVQMTPKELEDMIEKVIQGVDEESRGPKSNEDRMDRLERLLLEVNTGAYRENLSPARQQDASQRILEKLNDLDRKIDRNTDRMDNLGNSLQNPNQNQDKTVVINPSQPQQQIAPQMVQQPTETKVTTDVDGNTIVKSENEDKGTATGLVVNQGISVFTGVAIAEDAAMVIGIRGNYAFTNSPFKFMPDLYLAPGKDTGFGVNANVVVDFPVNTGVIAEPYVGLGLGYNQAAGESSFAPNLVLGTTFNVLGGKLFADYTAHNFFDIHQISIGYKLNL